MSPQSPDFGLKIETDGLVAKGVGCCAPIIEGAFAVTSREVKVFVYRLASSGGNQPFELSTALQ
jgi:hypothetical protein